MKLRILFAVLAFPVFSALAADIATNETLREIKRKDQSDRMGSVGAIDWSVVSVADKKRRTEVAQIMARGEVRTAEDFYNAAMVFQHGESIDDIRLAYSLASISAALDPANKQARWLTAAAWDRIMMRAGQPQWYGTQFTKPIGAQKFELYKIDESAVTDEERARLGVPPLSEAKAKAATIR
jgi:hypothetical protein